ncbi:MAG: glucan biosynthesis protein [Chthoniobacterales bacterium]|nr:glucan biosynthesis protein [Chthoniobacterales bacterium]
MALRAALCAIFLAATPSFAASKAEPVFTQVVRQAKAAARTPFQPNESTLPEVLRQLNYDTYRDITFRRERALWHDADEPFEVQFFHSGYLFDHPVRIHQVVDGEIRAVPFSPKYFRYPNFDPGQLRNESALGFAGFRILYPLNQPGRLDEVISFLGTNYFRALGPGQIYGLSARGIALNTGENITEEFPIFREYWLSRPRPDTLQMQFFALLDGPSVAGAYRFLLTPGKETRVEVEAHLFFRKAVEALGVAPLTSMFWRGENEPPSPNDKRPEVHDSDSLMIGGDWHPLHSVDKVTMQVFPENHPRAFTLLQRDRAPAHYRDREAKYERRPSVRVEPLGDWGEGSVRLLQLPAQNEYNDNVVVYWQPQKLPQTGDELDFKYRLHWFTRASNKP